MKVLHVIPGIEKISGGPSQAVIAICDALSKIGIEIQLVTTQDPLERYQLVDFESIQSKAIFFQRWKKERFAFSASLSKWLLSNIDEYDILHIHSYLNYPTCAAAAFSRRSKKPYIIRPAGTLNPWSIHQGAFLKNLWISLIGNLDLKNASALHATSIKEAEYLSMFTSKERIHVIPLGIDIPKLEPSSARASGDKLQILFLSRLHPKKNIPTLLAAIKKLVTRQVPIVLRIAGLPNPGQESYGDHLQKLVKKMGLEETVSFIGFVDGIEKTLEFKKAHLFVLPSYNENFGIAVVEAMAHRLPVIISKQIALAEDIHSAQAGLVVECNDTDGLADSIEKLVNNENLRLYMSSQARCLASKFSWLSTANALLELYQKVLNEPGL